MTQKHWTVDCVLIICLCAIYSNLFLVWPVRSYYAIIISMVGIMVINIFMIIITIVIYYYCYHILLFVGCWKWGDRKNHQFQLAYNFGWFRGTFILRNFPIDTTLIKAIVITLVLAININYHNCHHYNPPFKSLSIPTILPVFPGSWLFVKTSKQPMQRRDRGEATGLPLHHRNKDGCKHE